jgi:hypothetical protein
MGSADPNKKLRNPSLISINYCAFIEDDTNKSMANKATANRLYRNAKSFCSWHIAHSYNRLAIGLAFK